MSTVNHNTTIEAETSICDLWKIFTDNCYWIHYSIAYIIRLYKIILHNLLDIENWTEMDCYLIIL